MQPVSAPNKVINNILSIFHTMRLVFCGFDSWHKTVNVYIFPHTKWTLLFIKLLTDNMYKYIMAEVTTQTLHTFFTPENREPHYEIIQNSFGSVYRFCNTLYIFYLQKLYCIFLVVYSPVFNRQLLAGHLLCVCIVF